MLGIILENSPSPSPTLELSSDDRRVIAFHRARPWSLLHLYSIVVVFFFRLFAMDMNEIDQTRISLQQLQINQPRTTMEWTSGHETQQRQRHTTDQPTRTQNSTRIKRNRKKKKSWLLLKDNRDINTYYRLVRLCYFHIDHPTFFLY